jgi:hypothetical protein
MIPRRLIAFFLCLFIVTVSLKAQDSLLYQRISIPASKYSIEEALKVIEHETGLSFSYNTTLIDKKKIITLNATQEKVIDILNGMFHDPSLHFSVIGRHLVIYRPVKTRSIDPSNITDSVYFFVISGKVMDKVDWQPIPFSSVYLFGKATGTISNEEGEFSLKLSSADIGETLNISSMGYKNFSSPVLELVNTHNEYLLVADIIPIQEVIIRKINPDFLLRNANERISVNYPQEPAIITSFYRETVQQGSRYTMVSEAILEHFKSGYHNLVPDRVRILKGRKNEDFAPNDSVMLKLKAGLNTMLLLDVIKNMPDFLTGESLEDYHYRLADIVVEDGRDHYAIEFSPKPYSPGGAFYSGRIIIDINDMAFKWIEFHVSPEFLDIATERFIVRKPANMIVKTLKANYKVAFRKTGNHYFLHLITCETGFRIRYRRQLSGSVYNTNLETVVTDIDTLTVNKFSQRETARLYEIFSEQVGSYDETFWGEYNFISPDESLEKALSKLKTIDVRP